MCICFANKQITYSLCTVSLYDLFKKQMGKISVFLRIYYLHLHNWHLYNLHLDRSLSKLESGHL